MKKIFCIFMIAAICMALILPAAAVEIEEGTVSLEETLTATETADDATTSMESAESETQPDAGTETDVADESEIEAETKDIAAIINGAGSKIEAIIGIAGAMGITIEEAEAILDKMVSLGDEHLSDSDVWTEIKQGILENPEGWTVVAIVMLLMAALAIFLMRGQIKNTSAQAATKANIIDIKETESEMQKEILSTSAKLDEIGIEHEGIKRELVDIYRIIEDVHKKAVASNNCTDEIFERVERLLAEIDTLNANSETSLNVNKEQAFQTVQLLNIAMGRTPLNMSDATRNAWYEHAVARIKAAAGADGKSKTEASAPTEQ